MRAIAWLSPATWLTERKEIATSLSLLARTYNLISLHGLYINILICII